VEDLRRKRKRILIGGSLLGGGMSATIFFLLDVLFADMEQGTWRDAIARDLSSMFSGSVGIDSPAVWAVYMVVLAVLMGFGAFMGIVFFMFLERFFAFLKKG
jgi:hypothetical protein